MIRLFAFLLVGLAVVLAAVPSVEAGPPRTFGSCYVYPSSYSYGGSYTPYYNNYHGHSTYQSPSYSSSSYSPPYEKEAPYEVQPIIIQEKLVPAFVFQVMTAYAPSATQTQTVTPVAQPVAPQVTQVPQVPGTENDILVARKAVQILRDSGILLSTPSSDGLPVLEGQNPPNLEASSPSKNTIDSALVQRSVNRLHTLCFHCHSATNPKGDFVLFKDNAGQLSLSPYKPSGNPLTKGILYNKIKWDDRSAPEMPPEGVSNPAKRVPQEELKALESLGL